MKMIVMWLLGVPFAVIFFFAAFAVDASKIAPTEADEMFSAAAAAAPHGALSSKTKLSN